MRLVVSALVLIGAGCDAQKPEPGSLVLSTDRSTYAVVSDVRAFAENVGGEPVYLRQCGRRLTLEVQRREEGAWETAFVLNQPCQANLVMSPLALEAGEEREERFSFFAAGEYRLRAEWGAAGALILREEVSEPFTVTEP